MLIYSEQELEAFGAMQSPSGMIFMGKVFVKGQGFNRSMRNAVIDMARDNFRKGLPCIIVESDTVTTLWIEAPLSQSAFTSQGQPNGVNSPNPSAISGARSVSRESNATASLPSSNASTKGMIYRGQVMEAPTSSSPPPKQQTPSETVVNPVKKRLRYRGRLVD
ncbi:MAG: hypothetical protein AAGD25_29095 [Cyanobacteria bacterium P01_F01_bin.150]